MAGNRVAQAQPPLRRAGCFLALALGWSWAFWWAAVLAGRPFADSLTTILLVTTTRGRLGCR